MSIGIVLCSRPVLFLLYCMDFTVLQAKNVNTTAQQSTSWSIKVSIAAQKFATSCITDCKGSDTTWELRMSIAKNSEVIFSS